MGGLSPLYLIPLCIVGLIFPVMAVLNRKKINQQFLQDPGQKSSFYKQTINILIIMSVIILLLMFKYKHDLALIGLTFISSPLKLSALIVSAWLILYFLQYLKVTPKNYRRISKRYEKIAIFMPLNKTEYHWFVGLSFTAGICEEIIYRGFIYWQLHYYMPVIPAMIITNLVFALSHSATGLKNALYSFFLGMLWSILFVVTGSLWLAMFIHISVDMYSGTLGYRFLNTKFYENS